MNDIPAQTTATNFQPWERAVLEKLLFATLKEQRAKRRWSIFFKLLAFGVIGFLLYFWSGNFLANETLSHTRHTALIDIDGAVEAGAPGGSDRLIPALNDAFDDEGTVGVILRINSPGGTPVQAGLVNDEIMRLRKKYPQKPIYVVVEEMCASGAYYIAVAANKIYVNKASMVGSIGVLMDGFGFTGLMQKLGIERRLLTAGENKGFMDPFSQQSGKQVAYTQSILNEIHQQFIEAVRKGRGKRLKENPEIFTGLFWSGKKAIDLGLADEIGTVDSVARDVLKAEELVDYTQHEGWSDRLIKRFGMTAGAGAMQALQNYSKNIFLK